MKIFKVLRIIVITVAACNSTIAQEIISLDDTKSLKTGKNWKISFQAPRFDRDANKISNANMLNVNLNGYSIHENIELKPELNDISSSRPVERKSASEEEQAHNTAYYTLNQIQSGEKLSESQCVKTAKTDNKKKGIVKVEEKKKVLPTTSNPVKLAKRTTQKPKEWGNVDQVIRITAKPGMKFSIEEISAKAGEKIQIIFNNPDEMPHNLLIVNPGKGNEVGVAAIKLGANGLNMDYVPESDDVLFHTKLIGPGDSDTIFIQAPDKPGDYAYVCTYPGHYISMKGVLKVVK